MPRPKTLYGSLPRQLKDPDSFASQLKKILAACRSYDIAASRQILVPDVQHPGLLIMVHELPAGKGTQITALNFGSTPITETLHLPNIAPFAGPTSIPEKPIQLTMPILATININSNKLWVTWLMTM